MWIRSSAGRRAGLLNSQGSASRRPARHALPRDAQVVGKARPRGFTFEGVHRFRTSSGHEMFLVKAEPDSTLAEYGRHRSVDRTSSWATAEAPTPGSDQHHRPARSGRRSGTSSGESLSSACSRGPPARTARRLDDTGCVPLGRVARGPHQLGAPAQGCGSRRSPTAGIVSTSPRTSGARRGGCTPQAAVT